MKAKPTQVRATFVREAPDIRRQSLIEAAARCLAKYGAEGASVRAICRAAGVSSGLLTHYFSGIDELILATYHHVGARVAQAIDHAVESAGDDPRARLDAYVVASFQPPILDPELLATWLAFWGLVKTSPAVAAVHDELYAVYRSGIERLLIECLEPGAPPERVRLAGIAITALVDGLWLELCLDARSFTAEEATRMAKLWVETLLHRSAS